MTEEQKQEVAVFRFGVIAEFVGATRLDFGEQTTLLKQKCARKWQIPCSGRTRLSRSTLLRWIRCYNSSGGKLESLCPKQRKDNGKTRALDEETGLALTTLRRQLPKVPVPELTRIMHERQLVTRGIILNLSTTYRFLHQHQLMGPAQQIPTDRRKFEAELPNDLWQSDVMHGPLLHCGNQRRKAYLIAFIDDHSRIIPHARFYPSEALAPFMEAFEIALRKRGLPRKLYVDNGSAFRSRQLESTTAELGIALIHAKPYQPQGKGKIERFFKTVRSQFLSSFTTASLDATSFEEFNAAFVTWLERYHQRSHSSTGQSPFKRFTANLHCLRTTPENLKDYFRTTARRRVNKDRTVVVDKRLFEAPVALIGKRVEIRYHAESPEQAEVVFDGQSYGLLSLVDLHVNSRVKRDKNGQVELSGETDCHSGQLWEKPS